MAARLTEKQKRFVTEYLIDLNATAAARRAGYKDANKGRQLVAKGNVSSAIQEAIAKRAARTEISQDRVLQEYARIAFFDSRKLFKPDGTPLPVSELDDDTAAAIAGLDVQQNATEAGNIVVTKKYRMADKLRALDSVAKHLGMFDGHGGAADALAKLDEVLRSIGGVE